MTYRRLLSSSLLCAAGVSLGLGVSATLSAGPAAAQPRITQHIAAPTPAPAAVMAAPCMDDDPPASKAAARAVPEQCPVRFELCDKLYKRGAWERSMSCVDNVKDLSLMRCISHVERLTVRADEVEDWRHLAALTELTELELRGTGSVDLRALTPLKRLRRLTVRGPRLRRQSALGAFTQLRQLVLLSKHPVDVRQLAKLPELRELYLASASDLAFSKDLTKLRALSVERVAAADLSVLRHQPCLNRFELQGGSVRRYPAQWPSRLATLQLSGVGLTSVPRGLAGLPLSHVDLSNNNIARADLSRWSSLTRVMLNHNPISLSQLALPPGTQQLHLDHTATKQLAQVAKLRQLEILHVSHTAVRDLGPLAQLRRLRWLDISHTEVEDVSALLTTPRLNHANISQAPVRLMDLMTIKAQRRAFSFVGRPRKPSSALKMAQPKSQPSGGAR